uniref:Uncharacterized protein n=1 Tax=Anopheles coluzzii TaxID=1518534 RepID=A0A8W7PR51_ANOCL
MERNPDKKSGLVYHAAERACKRRFEEVEREFRRARQPELPTVENQADDAEPSYMEPGPSCFTDDAAPLSDSEEDSMADASSGAESDDVEDIQVEVQTPDQPYEDLSCEEGLRLWALQTGQTHRSLNHLLGHLRQHFPNARLPKDARTLMNTPASRAPETAITPIAGGTLWYQGVGKCLLSYFR